MSVVASSETPTETTRASKPVSEPVKTALAQETGSSPVSEIVPSAIIGQVVDGDTGQGVAGAEVVAMEGATETGEARKTEAVSADTGRFEINGLQAGGFLLMKEAGPGDYMVSLEGDMVDVRLKDGERKEGIVLLTRKGGTVSGLVTGERGSPIAGAEVKLVPARNESFQGIRAAYSNSTYLGVYAATETDASGQYTFRGVKLGKSCAATANASGYMPVRSPEFSLADAGTSKRVNFRLSRGSTIAGWVEDREGNRRSGMELILEPDFEGHTHVDTLLLMAVARRASGAKSDTDGRFRFEGLPEGKYHLFAGGIYRSPYRRLGGGTCVEVDGSQGVEDIVVRANSLERGDHRIAGRVSNAEGAPVAGAQIDIVTTQVNYEHFYVQTDETGMFLADGLAFGRFALLATAAGYAQSILSPVPLDEQDLAITLLRTAAIRGHVLELDSGRPLAGATVTVAQHDRPERSSSSDTDAIAGNFDAIRDDIVGIERATTDADGAFELAAIEPGHVRLKAERTGYAASFGEELIVEAGQDVGDTMIRMGRGATVEGIVHATSGEPVGGASILVIETAVAQEGPGGAEGRLIEATNMGEGCRDIRAITGVDGRFVVDGLADGDYWMRAIAADYAPSAVTKVSVSGGASQDSVELVLDPGGTLEGRVTQGGMPKQDVLVQTYLRGANAEVIRVYTDADGHYMIRHLSPGEHHLRAVYDMARARPGRSGIIDLDVSIVSGQTTQQDLLYSSHSVSGVVSGLTNPAEWEVTILRIPEDVDPEAPPDMSIDWPSFVAETATINVDGSYVVENLADGVYKLEVFQFQNDVIVPKGVWKTISIEGEDLVVDVQSSD
jgi:protocatechuate 3,4-dioxygenase beta subunit